jgi:hypothetical protein
LRRSVAQGAELTLATGAFLVGYLRRFGILGTGLGSQVYIGQLYALGIGLTAGDLKTIMMAGTISALSAIVPRMLSGPVERPPPFTGVRGHSIALSMGLQAAIAAAVIVGLDRVIGLTEAAWAITACTYVIGNSTAGTFDRVRRRDRRHGDWRADRASPSAGSHPRADCDLDGGGAGDDHLRDGFARALRYRLRCFCLYADRDASG